LREEAKQGDKQRKTENKNWYSVHNVPVSNSDANVLGFLC